MKFAREAAEPVFETRAALAGKDARALATEILPVSEGDFRTACKGSAIKRAKLAGLQRSAILSTDETRKWTVQILWRALDESGT